MVEALVSAALGPFGALSIMMLILWGIYKFATVQAFPLLKEYVANQQKNVEAILAEHKKDREVFEATIVQLTKRQDRVEEDIEDIKTDIKVIKERG